MLTLLVVYLAQTPLTWSVDDGEMIHRTSDARKYLIPDRWGPSIRTCRAHRSLLNRILSEVVERSGAGKHV